MDDVVTMAEAVALTHKSQRTLLRYIDEGRLVPAMKLPGKTGAYLFRRADIRRIILENAGFVDEATA